MSILLCLLISIAVNLDNFLIGINLGLKGRRLSILSNIMIALMSAAATFLAAMLTWLISDELIFAGTILGALLLIVFGGYCLLRPDDNDGLSEKYQELSPKKALILGFLLSVNCIPPALSAGMLDIQPWAIGLFAGIFSFLCMHLSNRFGIYFLRFSIIRKLTPLSNLILIVSGVIELLVQLF